jgi:5S rRNA maturation endonuclease (ribonuclease M5)
MKTQHLQTSRNCELCGTDNTHIIYDFPPGYYNRETFTTFSWDGGLEIGLKIVQCNSCGLIYQNPCITPEAMKYVYPESIIPEHIDYKKLLDTHKFGLILDLIRKHLKNASGADLNAVDIGTRYGVLPMLMNQLGLKAYGLEYNKKCVEAARKSGCDCIHQGELTSLKQLAESVHVKKFNIITMIDVIEHLLNPLEEIKLISELQSSGDVAIITTMDTDSLGHRLFKKYWYYIHSQHTFYFTKETLVKLFARHGYTLDEVVSIPGYKSIPQIPTELNKLRKHIAKRGETKGAQQEWFAANRPHLYDLFTLVFRKS